jgi:hypothetical protein
MLDTLLLRPSLHFTTLHPTTLHSTSLHLSTLLFLSFKLHPTTLHSTSLHLSTLHFLSFKLHPTTLHSTSLHLSTLHFLSLNFTQWHCTTLSFGLTPLKFPTAPLTTNVRKILPSTSMHFANCVWRSRVVRLSWSSRFLIPASKIRVSNSSAVSNLLLQTSLVIEPHNQKSKGYKRQIRTSLCR